MAPIVEGVSRWTLWGLVSLAIVLSSCTSGGSGDHSQGSSTTSGPAGGGSSTTATVPAQSPTTGATATATTAARACRGSDLQVTLGSSQGLGGTTYTPLILKNRSASACTLNGHPDVAFLDRSGRVIGQAAFTGESPTPVAV